MLASLLGQLLTCVIALAALWKDWADYGAISKRFGRRLPIFLAVIIIGITSLTISQTWQAEKRETLSVGRIQELGTQIKRNEKSAELRAKQQTESFQTILKTLYTRLSELQKKVDTDPLLRQNRVLLKEIQDTREQINKAKAYLEQPPKLAELIATFGEKPDQADLSEISVPRRDDGTVELLINIVNNSSVQAKEGAIWVRLCIKCSFAEEPKMFTKAVGTEEYDRYRNFQVIHAGTAISIPLKIRPPAMANRFEIDVTLRCENCTTSPAKKMIVYVR